MDNSLVLSDLNNLGVDDPRQRMDCAWLESLLRDIDSAAKRVDKMHELCAAYPDRLTYGSLRRKYYAWKESKKERAVLVDKRKLRKLTKENDYLNCYRFYCENHNRNNKAGYDAMMMKFISGEPLEFVGTWRDVWARERASEPMPEKYPVGWTPRGMNYSTLQRWARAQPNYNFSILASRLGRKAAQDAILPVLRTRVGLLPGQVYQYDDVHVDVTVRMDGTRLARPLMFTGYDVASGHRIATATRPQFVDDKSERKDSLKEKEFRYMFAHVLTDLGIHKDGTQQVIEHGTTAIRPTLELKIKAIPRYGNLITFVRSGILAEAVHPGFFSGNGGGNYRIKACCERNHRTSHTMRGMLPGQTGQDADHAPEHLPALKKYEEKLMAAAQMLPPEYAEKIIYNLLSWPEWTDVEKRIDDYIAHDHNHMLEGWTERKETVWRYTDKSEWLPLSALESLSDNDRACVKLMLSQQPGLVSVRRMSRMQVWQSGQDELVRIPIIELPNLLELSDARVVKVRVDGTIAFRDKFYFGDDEVIYHAQATSAQGYRTALAPHSEWLLYVTPYHPECGVLVDRASGNTVGVIPMYKRAPWGDRDALVSAMGAQNHDKATKLLDLRGRHQRDAEKRLTIIGSNEDVIAAGTAAAKAGKLPAPPKIKKPKRGNLSDFIGDQFDDDIHAVNNFAGALDTLAEITNHD